MKYIEALDKVQNRATKALPELRGLCYDKRLKSLQLPTLAYRRLRGDMIETYKITNGIYDTDVLLTIKFRGKISLRGHSKTLMKDKSKRQIRSNNG